MDIRPEPDRDSRYPDRYCTTCGKGFKAYLECLGDNPDDAIRYGIPTGPDCNMDGVVPPNPPNPDWDKPLSAAVETILSAKACPNAPMNATLDDGWTTAPIVRFGPYDSLPHSGELPDELTQREYDRQANWNPSLPEAGEPKPILVIAAGTPIENKPSTGSDDGWTTAPIVNKSQT